MNIDRHDLNPTMTVLQPIGGLDLVTADFVKESIAQAVGSGHMFIIVDLKQVGFIDSSGVGALISGLTTARRVGGDLRIARPGDQVSMVLELTHLDQLLQSYHGFDDAMCA